ncbi:DUF1015 domain-containing protein [Maribacter aestuarii]|uniref:DUF1015 domain-containing protein n=1 Tax=Maribacter aestuarii TaxID=1130723 RepID=UPI00248D36F1|nr:DUF1015 domain-containing protein [Maribacter aestuarii]
MADVKPFRAIRPTKDKVAFVVSKSYQEYSQNELKASLKFNPFTFLHIINPGFKFDKKVTGSKRFALVRNRYLEFLEEGIFKKDKSPGYYLYEINNSDFKSYGLFCATSVADYRNGIIKKHEDTIKRREELFANYLKTVRFNTEPVLMTYEENLSTKNLMESQKSKSPDYHFTTTDKVTHKLWVISEIETCKQIEEEFKKVKKLYIADGHHRSASSDLLCNLLDNKNVNTEKASSFFMSYLIPESEIKIYEFNRMIKDLNGLDKEEFLIRLDAYYRIENKGAMLYRPSRKNHFSMYLDGEFYALYLRKKVYNFTDALSRLDTQILYTTILQPILGISDLRNDKRIAYGCGKHNSIHMKNEIDSGNFEVGFSMLPVTIKEIKEIADAGLVMPPKSTYIEPKLRSGLAIYEI